MGSSSRPCGSNQVAQRGPASESITNTDRLKIKMTCYHLLAVCKETKNEDGARKDNVTWRVSAPPARKSTSHTEKSQQMAHNKYSKIEI